MEEIRQKTFKGERPLFASRDIRITDCVFKDGESPLKESSGIEIESSLFQWKYPLWYCRDVRAVNCAWFENARAGVWYTDRIEVAESIIRAPKNFRRCRDVTLREVAFTDARETLWSCTGVRMKNVSAVNADYFAMNSKDIEVDGLMLDGNYSFDGAENVRVRNAKLITKDAFWNSRNVTVEDSFISCEYLGWNSADLTLVNCTVESSQAMCYIENLKLVNCKLINTTLAFEYSSVDADIDSGIDSVFNPKSGRIRAKSIGELILESDRIDPSATMIESGVIGKTSSRPEWARDGE